MRCLCQANDLPKNSRKKPSNKLPNEAIPLRKLPSGSEPPPTACKLAQEIQPRQAAQADEQAEIARLKAELRRVTKERDILKKAAANFAREHE